MQINTSKNSGTEPILKVRELTKYYKCEDEINITKLIGFLKRKEELGIKGVSFDISKGKAIGIIGKKKCGKSTLLKLLSGLTKPSSGWIISKGFKLSSLQLQEMVSYISKEHPCSQEYSCTLFENLIQYACRGSENRSDVVGKAEKLIESFDFEDYKFKEVIKLPSEIRSKMFIVRGFLSHKDILCFDQPLAFFREEEIKIFEKYVKELVQTGKTIIISSDEENIVKNICDDIITI